MHDYTQKYFKSKLCKIVVFLKYIRSYYKPRNNLYSKAKFMLYLPFEYVDSIHRPSAFTDLKS